MLKEDKLTLSLIALPFVLVIFIISVVLINSNRVSSSRSKPFKASVQNVQIAKDIWIKTDKKQITAGENFDFSIFINTNQLELGAFNMELNLVGQDFVVNEGLGNKGVSRGSNAHGFTVISDLNNNKLKLTGICVQNCIQGQNENMITIHVKALKNLNLQQPINYLRVTELANTLGKNFDIKKYQGNILIK